MSRYEPCERRGKRAGARLLTLVDDFDHLRNRERLAASRASCEGGVGAVGANRQKLRKALRRYAGRGRGKSAGEHRHDEGKQKKGGEGAVCLTVESRHGFFVDW